MPETTTTTKQFLDFTGLQIVWEKIKSNFIDNTELSQALADYQKAATSANKLVLEDTKLFITDAKGNKLEQTGFDVSTLPDGFIKSVTPVTVPSEKEPVTEKLPAGNYIKFVWTDAAKIEPVYVPVASEKSKPLTGDNTTIEVKDDVISVKEVSTDKIKPVDTITINGGPLDTPAMRAAFPDGIPTNMSMQDILSNLFVQDIYPTASNTNPSFTATIEAPAISANKSNGAIVTIGDTIVVNEIKANAVSISKTNPKVSGMTHGYATGLNGEGYSANTSATTAWTINQSAETNYVLTPTLNGPVEPALSPVTKPTVAEAKISSFSFKTVKGVNKISVKEDAPQFEGTYETIPSYFIKSNLGHYAEGHKTTSIVKPEPATTHVAASKTGSFSVTAVYPVYHNGIKTGLNTTSADTVMLKDDKVFEVEYGKEDNAYDMFAFPTEYTLDTVEVWNAEARAYQNYPGGKKTTTADKVINGATINYTTWERQGAKKTESEKYRFTLNKKVSE